MSESTLSKRARKKQPREAQSQGTAHSDSAGSDPAKKDDLSTTPTLAGLDSEFKIREGISPFVDVVLKKVRNLTKRRVCLDYLNRKLF
jgi:hypothetical protein